MYKCEFPDCGHSTEDRNQIHSHHIVPKELDGVNDDYNKISVCPNCHNRIYVEGTKSGIHSIKNKNSIILNGWLTSTNGKVLEYIDVDGEIEYHFNGE